MRRVDRPDPMPDGMGLLHIGPPKTGTSALQTALHTARDALAEQGVEYVAPGVHPFNVARFAAGWDGGARRDSYQRRWDAIATAFRTSTARHPVLSSEGFFGARPERIDAIGDALGRDLTVVVAMRPMAELLPSVWQQVTREGGTTSFDDWLTAALDAPVGQGPLRVVETAAVLDAWGARFGADRIVVLCGGSRDHGSQLRAVGDLLGVPGALQAEGRGNASSSYAATEMLRHLHRAHDAPIDPDVWIRVLRRTARELNARPGPRGAAIEVPRWAVEAANERDRAAVATLEQSDVVVVGDPAAVVVDPDDHPEVVAAPELIDTATAGWFASTLAQTAVAETAAARDRTTPPAAGPAPGRPLGEASTRELVRALGRRIGPARRGAR